MINWVVEMEFQNNNSIIVYYNNKKMKIKRIMKIMNKGIRVQKYLLKRGDQNPYKSQQINSKIHQIKQWHLSNNISNFNNKLNSKIKIKIENTLYINLLNIKYNYKIMLYQSFIWFKLFIGNLLLKIQ